MFKTDCVMAEIHNGSCACSGLTETLCITKGKCKFYKTKKTAEQERERCARRIAELKQKGVRLPDYA